jgi:DNA-binding LacI/PurR family transcriptional regulator
MPTIRDVAFRAGVAISTVSAVINRSAPTSVDVVARVEQAIAEIGYMPQRAAQTLRSGRSQLIGLIIPDITNPHFAALARVVENACLRAGYMTFVYSTDEDSEREMRILRMMRMQRVAGLILISTRSNAKHGKRLMSEIDAPTILMGSRVAGAPYDFVSLDDIAAGRLAAERLLGLGHRRIAVIGGRVGVSSHEERLKGCRLAHAHHGLVLHEDQIVLAQFSADLACERTLNLLNAASPPTAILSLSNFMTLGVMRAFSQMNIACPRDISLIGVDDLEWADLFAPRPTLVAQPVAEMTETAISMLLEQIAEGRSPEKRVRLFDPKLIVRESCGPAKSLAATL